MERQNVIQLHGFRNNWFLDSQFDVNTSSASDFLDKIDSSPYLLSSIADYLISAGVYNLVKRGDQDEFIRQLRIVHLSRTWHWRGMQDEGPHTVALPDLPAFECGRIRPNPSVDLGTWLEGIYIAMILRDIEAVKVYSQADPEKITRYGQNKPDPWEIPYIKFLNGIWAFDTQLLHNLKDAMIGCDPKLYNPERADYLLNIISPVMELWVKVLGGDEAAFSECLYQQQKIRHDWHEALGDDTGNSIMEYIDLAALAAVCYAHDKGMKVEVKSDYLPEFLINGDFPKLEWPAPEWQER